ncbi:metallophosphoesterase [Urechidicola croceus]|uniref:Phosphoesterase n=1 Tax=Urechidicola croceus TaxID=1850246 RepID=A0A1D8P7W0_9FLAO|nr:metallophosphoesterase [Urechidicola croceus]AOW20652.1 phosphoesterase [Urechidicola croceus]
MKKFYKILLLALFVFVVNACATYKPQYADKNYIPAIPESKEIAHSFYLIGDAGNAQIGESTQSLKVLKEKLKTANDNTTVLFLGDNIYPAGMPKKGHKNREFAEHQLDIQTDVVKEYAGNAFFIPGNHDWYSGLKGLERQQDYVQKKLDSKKVFYPENGCPIEQIKISDNIVVIAIDSEWYITNWDKNPNINDDCEIKSREKFFEELEGLIKKNANKTTIIAIHHPMFTYGPHGGEFSLDKQIFPKGKVPLPGVGSLINILRKTSGISPADLQNKLYKELQERVVTLSQFAEKVVFVSGHEHNLQYIVEDNTPQIVSGAGSKREAARVVNGSKFSYGGSGYAKYDVFTDGSSQVSFYDTSDGVNEKLLFVTEVLPKDNDDIKKRYPEEFESHKTASVYTKEKTTKNKFHRSVWGERYRQDYSTLVNAPTVNIDTLFGGLKALRKGGGHQSKSLRLENPEGKEYVMRALKKSAEIYLQAMAFKDQYIVGQFENTYTEDLLLDFYTGSQPYAPFTTATLSDAIDVYHTNPRLFYIPKQKSLGVFNNEFGDELYMIEERVTSGHGDQKSFGNADKIISTDDLFKKLRKNNKHQVDKTAYVRARLFDMLIGDWDRHVDQWRWAVFEENDMKIYKPIPRDRDQTFSNMGDGPLMRLLTRIIPPLKLMEGFNEDIRSVKSFNASPYSLDMVLINDTNKELWDEQAIFIQKNITDEVIDEALKFIPKEINRETVAEIKRVLIQRRNKLKNYSDEYFEIIKKYAVIKGTDRDDWFEIIRLPNGKTKVTTYNIKKNKKDDITFEHLYDKSLTEEIWIYGLDDDDYFEVKGKGNSVIPLRIVGGQNNDTYVVENGRKVSIYDYKSKKNDVENAKKARVKLTDDYETNVYSYKKIKNNTNQIIPVIGYNPDDGVKFGISDTYTVYGFERNPFTSQHIISGAYYFATNGFELSYNGEFANVIGKANLGIETKYTSPNFSGNFFGYGNATPNFDEELGLDYNRVKLSMLKFAPSLIWRGRTGASFKTSMIYESVEVEETEGRYVNTFYVESGEENTESFIGFETDLNFKNKDNDAFPTLGMQTGLTLGYKSNINNSNGFGYVIPSLGFDYKLVSSGQLVFATLAKAHIMLGDDYEFYQAANIGGNNGLRGYRNERFTGSSSFVQSTDLRLNLRKVQTAVIPLNIGIYAGFDYGKVWIEDNLFYNPDFHSENWNTSVGGGIFFNAADVLSGNLAAFNSDDGVRITFGIGFGF